MSSICPCFLSEKAKATKFEDKWLKVKKTIEPGLINWHNFGVHYVENRLRVIMFWASLTLILIFCFLIVVERKKNIITALEQAPDLLCSSTPDETTAFLDFFNANNQRTGAWHCFCHNNLKALGHEAVSALSITQGDFTAPCSDWLEHFDYLQTSPGRIGCFIAFVNVMIEVLVNWATDFRRPVNETMNVIDSIAGICRMQFLNLGLILISSTINFKVISGFSILRILDGQYDEFSADFYQSVAPEILSMFFFQLLTPHIIPLL